MQEAIIEIKEGKAYIKLMKEFFEKEAVLNAAYKNTDKYSVMMTGIEDSEIRITLEPMNHQTMKELESAVSDFCNEVLDQQIRINLEKRYGKIRELIVEHAFSPLADLKSRLKKIK